MIPTQSYWPCSSCLWETLHMTVPAYLSPFPGSVIFMNVTKSVSFRCLSPSSLHLSLFFPSPSYLFFLLLLPLFFFFVLFWLLQTSHHLLQCCYESGSREAVKGHAICCLTARLSHISDWPVGLHTLLVIQQILPHSPAWMPFSFHVSRSSETRLQWWQLPPTLSYLLPILQKGWPPTSAEERGEEPKGNRPTGAVKMKA